MIGTVSVRVSVARPNMPLEPVTVFAGSAATVGVIDVPKVKCGVKVTGVGVSLTNADGVTQSVNAKLVSGVWCATFPSSHFTHTGFTGEGLQIVCGGTDENDVVRAWKLGVGDVTTAAADPSAVPADTSFASMKLRDAVPMAPVKGDFAVVNGRWSVWTGTAWSQVSDGSGEMNVIEKVQKNGVDLPITNKTVNVTVPTQASDIGAYALPTGGIPSTDMTSAVQTALAAAGTAVQPEALATVATTGAYADLTGTPTIPAAQIQSDWNQTDTASLDFIKNKPTIPGPQELRYSLTDTMPSALVDRACNVFQPQSSNFTLTLPSATQGFARDFLFLFQANAAISITFPTTGGETYYGDSGAFGALTANKLYLFSLTEITENVFLVGRKELTAL